MKIKKYVVRLKEDVQLFNRVWYAGWEVVVSDDVYKQIKDKVEVVKKVEEEVGESAKSV